MVFFIYVNVSIAIFWETDTYQKIYSYVSDSERSLEITLKYELLKQYSKIVFIFVGMTYCYTVLRYAAIYLLEYGFDCI